MNSELENSETSNSCLPPMRSKISRGFEFAEEVDVDALDLDVAGAQRVGAIIEAAGQGQA